MRVSTALLAAGIAIMVSGCGGSESDSDTDERPPPIPIQVEAAPSDSFENATVVAGTDSNGVDVQVVVESSFASGVTIYEGLDLGLPGSFSHITNGFIEIALPPEATGKQIVKVMSPTAFEVVVTLDQANSEMSYTPFYSKGDGTIEFFVAPINGSIAFALMDVPEF